MDITWEDSGRGAASPSVTLEHANALALSAGFTFPDGKPNLAAMFERHGVNGLSAFRAKFANYRLGGAAAGAAACAPPPRRRWAAVADARTGERYVGSIDGAGRRHGVGALLAPGARAPTLYVGGFAEGVRHGPGVVATPRGERAWGDFRDGHLWGPCEYLFASPEGGVSACAGASLTRVRFDGVFSGRPAGRGVLTWADGRREAGVFDGAERMRPLGEAGVRAAVAAAAQSAARARRAAAEVEAELRRQGLGEEFSALQRALEGGEAGWAGG